MRRIPGWIEVVVAALAVLLLLVMVVSLASNHPRNEFSNISPVLGT